MDTDNRLVLVVLHASDLAASLQVYRDIFQIPLASSEHDPPDDPWVGGLHAALSWHQGAYLHFAIYPALPPERPVTTGAQVGFLVADTLETHSRAVAGGVPVLHEPRTEPWGSRRDTWTQTGTSSTSPHADGQAELPPNKGLQRAAYRGANQPLWHHATSNLGQQLAVTSAAAEPLVR
ncbi:MAG: VOC family protein [Deltaproteobacteria bacterium]|nr:VOC family protein [Deltaproteobacteria bacterium]